MDHANALAREVVAVTRCERQKIEAISTYSGVDVRIVRRASSARPISAQAYLQLCGACGLDPMTRKKLQCPWRFDQFDFKAFGGALLAFRRDNGDTIRDARKKSSVSIATLSRMENGGNNTDALLSSRPSISSVLAACAYAKIHPNAYCKMSNGKHSGKHIDNTNEKMVGA